MTEFEKELEKNMKLNKVAYERENIYSDFLISKRDIERVFHDWQPPKPLVVVPQIMADFIEEWKEEFKLYGAFFEISEAYGPGTELYDLVFQKSNGQDLFARAWLDGYTVEKEKKYLLKHIDFCKTDKHYDWFTIKHSDGPLNHLRVEKGEKPSTIDCKFTKQEIDSMQTGSYERIEVDK